MKKLVYSLVITFLMGLSVNTIAQNAKQAPVATVAYLNLKTAKKIVDEKTAIVTFQLNNISDESIKERYRNSFSKFQRVQEVTATLQKGNMASFSIKMDKTGTLPTLQKMLATARVESVNIDGKLVATKDLAKYKQENAKK